VGLDPLKEEEFQDCIREVRDEGRTVLLSSHILAEVEELCDRVSIIRAGRTVESGTLTELRRVHRTMVIAETERPPSQVADLPGVSLLDATGNRVRLEVANEHLAALIALLSGLGIVSLESHPPTLEELFLAQYGVQPDEPVR
jgi:ABC-2 type transport system ATP-binding protein